MLYQFKGTGKQRAYPAIPIEVAAPNNFSPIKKPMSWILFCISL
jgi:hypothetical protein